MGKLGITPETTIVSPKDAKSINKQINAMAIEAKEKGNEAFNKDDYKSAIHYYSKAIRLNPNNCIFYSNRACVYLKLERYCEAITDCTISIMCTPNIKAYARRANAKAALLQYESAYQDYHEALRFEPTNQACLADLLKCLQAVKRQCKQQLQEPNTNRAVVEEVQAKLGQIQEEIGKVKPQVKSANSPSSASNSKKSASDALRSTEGDVLSDSSEPFDQSGAESPEFFSPITTAQKQLHENIAYCTKLLNTDATNSAALCERARSYEMLGELEKALADYRTGLRLDPDNKQMQQRYKYALKYNREAKDKPVNH